MSFDTGRDKEISALRRRLQVASSHLRKQAISFKYPVVVSTVVDSDEWVAFPGGEPVETRTIRREGDRVLELAVHWPRTSYFPPHVHPETTEEFFVEKGSVIFFVEHREEPIDIGPGESLTVPAGVAHALVAHAGTEVRVVFHPPIEAFRQ